MLIDNGDSFTVSLAGACRAAGAHGRNRQQCIRGRRCLAYALRHDALIMLSPGQGGPRDAGCCMELIALAAGRVPLIGICLGHQAIVEHHGGHVVRAHEPCHGKSSAVDHDGDGRFRRTAQPDARRALSFTVHPAQRVPTRLPVHAVLDGMAMAVSNADEGQFGLQFHPESILTPLGARLIDGMLGWADGAARAPSPA